METTKGLEEFESKEDYLKYCVEVAKYIYKLIKTNESG